MDFIKILLADTTFTFAAEIVLRSVLEGVQNSVSVNLTRF